MRFSTSSIWDKPDPMALSNGAFDPQQTLQSMALQSTALAPLASAYRPTSSLIAGTSQPATGASLFSASQIAAASATATAAMKGGALQAFDMQLTALYYQYGAGTATAQAMKAFTSSVQQFNGSIHADAATGKQYVAVDFAAKDGNGAHLLQELNALGLQHGASFGGMAGGDIDVSQLGAVLKVADLGSAHESGSMTSSGLVDNQADHSLLTDAARGTHYGINGGGLTIGVISDSFNTSGNGSMATDETSGDLPNGVSPQFGFTPSTGILPGEDFAGGTDEGRAMAQIIHDEAPGASILFATGDDTQAAFAQHILDLAAAGAKIIVDDLTYYAEPDYQNGVIAQAIEQVEAQGVIYLSSAGNDASKGLEVHAPTHSGVASLPNSDGEDLYNLTNGATPYFWGIHIPNGRTVTITLQWAQPAYSADAATTAAHSTSDLDLFLYDSAGNYLAKNDGFNDTAASDPIVVLQYTNSSGGTLNANIAVGIFEGLDPSDIKITVLDDGAGTTVDASPLNTNTGTVVGHHGTPGSIAVAADDAENTPVYGIFPYLENYSSSGPMFIYFDDAGNLLPAPLVVHGPQVTGVDGGSTSFFGQPDVDGDGYPDFFGTSAAAPSIAAVVALLLQADPTLTYADILAVLQNSSWDIGPVTGDAPVGIDDFSGSGLVNAAAALNEVVSHTATPQPYETVFQGTHENDVFAFDGLAYVFGGPAARVPLLASDMVDGKGGNNTVSLNGDYTGANAVVMNATTLLNIQLLALSTGFSYTLTTADATVASGATMIVDGSSLGPTNVLTFDASAETDGFFNIMGGLGADVIRFSPAGLKASDMVNGGTGASLDSLVFTTAGTAAATAFANVSHIEQVFLANGTNSVTLTDAMVSSADDSHVLYVYGGTGNDTVNATGVTTTTNRLFITAGAGNDTLAGGFGADTFYFSTANLTALDLVNGNTGAALDRIVFTDAGTVAAGAFAQVTHVEQLVLANGTNNITVPDALVGGNDGHILYITGSAGDDTVNASAVTTTTNRVYITAGSGNDTLTGGLGLDIFYFAAAVLTSADTVNGGGGALADTLAFTTAGTIAATAFAGVSHIEEVVLANGTNNVTLTDALVGSADDGHLLYAFGGTGDDTIDGSGVTTAANRISFISSSGTDTLTGGAGSDIFYFTPANLTGADTVNGGTGASVDSIVFSAAGTIAASAFAGVSHIEQITLFNGTNNLTLTDALVGSADDGHVLHVTGGTGADTIDASGVTTAANRVVFIGGAGADNLTGGAGGDFFSYLAVTDSSSTAYDTITALSFTADRIDLPVSAGTVSLIEGPRGGALDSASFNGELGAAFATLGAHHAGLMTATSGTLNGQTFLVVDCNGVTGYQANADLVLHLVSPTGTLAVGDFV